MQTSFTASNPAFEQRVRDSFELQNTMKTLGATIRSVAPGKVSIGMPYREELTQQNGFIHGGISATLLDSACGYAAFTLMPENATVLTIEFKINLLSPATGDWFEAVGRVKKPGRNVTVSDGELYAYEGENKKLVASMTGTMMAVYDRKDISP